MRTIMVGTLEEWSKFKPDAMLINRKVQYKYTSNGVCISHPQEHETPKKWTYYSLNTPDSYNDDYAPPFYLAGSGCPYIVKAKHKYSVSIYTVYGGGCSYPITKDLWDDPNWEEIENLKDAWIEK